MLLKLSQFFSPLYSPQPCTHLPPTSPTLRSCPWVVHISSSASPFPILFITSPYLFCTYQLSFLFPVPFLPFFPVPLPTDTLHVISIYVILFLWMRETWSLSPSQPQGEKSSPAQLSLLVSFFFLGIKIYFYFILFLSIFY